MTTRADLKAMRLRLGMAPVELAGLFGKSGSFINDIERGKFNTTPPGLESLLLDLQTAFDDMIDAIVERHPPAIVAYAHQETFALYEPAWVKRVRLHSVWLAACGAARIELPHAPHIVYLDTDGYMAWLKGRDDSVEMREAFRREFPPMPRARKKPRASHAQA